MIATPILPQLLPLFAVLLLLAVACFAVAAMGVIAYRWKRQRHEDQRRHGLVMLRAYAAHLVNTKGEGIEA